jgi:hypothetical protein
VSRSRYDRRARDCADLTLSQRMAGTRCGRGRSCSSSRRRPAGLHLPCAYSAPPRALRAWAGSGSRVAGPRYALTRVRARRGAEEACGPRDSSQSVASSAPPPGPLRAWVGSEFRVAGPRYRVNARARWEGAPEAVLRRCCLFGRRRVHCSTSSPGGRRSHPSAHRKLSSGPPSTPQWSQCNVLVTRREPRLTRVLAS